MEDEMVRYYEERAPVYDRVYHYPERQEDLRILEQKVVEYFSGRSVLEVAAGTGYWSQFICRTARRLVATDVNAAPLAALQQRDLVQPVKTLVADGYSLEGVEGQFDGGFAGLWFSHIPIAERVTWLETFHARLEWGARVMMVDNTLTQTVRLPVIATDDAGNTYQDRTTDDGQTYRVVKNFPTASELTALVADPHARFTSLTHFWIFEYTVV